MDAETAKDLFASMTDDAPQNTPRTFTVSVPERHKRRWEKAVDVAGSVLGRFIYCLFARMPQHRELIAEYEKQNGPGTFRITDLNFFILAVDAENETEQSPNVVELTLPHLARELFGRPGYDRGLVPGAIPEDCIPALLGIVRSGRFDEFTLKDEVFLAIERYIKIVVAQSIRPALYSSHIDSVTAMLNAERFDNVKCYLSIGFTPNPAIPLNDPCCNQVLVRAQDPNSAIKRIVKTDLRRLHLLMYPTRLN